MNIRKVESNINVDNQSSKNAQWADLDKQDPIDRSPFGALPVGDESPHWLNNESNQEIVFLSHHL